MGAGTLAWLLAVLLAADAHAAPANVLSCAANQDGGFATTSASAVEVRSCTIEAPQAGKVLAVGTSSMGTSSGGNYEARFGLSLDSTSPDIATDRWMNAYTNAGDGRDRNVATQMVRSVGAGTHVVRFLVSRYNGAGTVQLYDPSLTVLFVPDEGTPYRLCGVTANAAAATSSTSFEPMASCTVDVPGPSLAIALASTSVGIASGGAAFEGRFRIGVDGSTFPASDRWTNVTTDAGDGADDAVVTQLSVPVAAGQRTFSFERSRYSGTGPVQAYDPGLAVLVVPDAASPANRLRVCTAGGSDSWTNATTSYTTLRSCTVAAVAGAQALALASASMGLVGPAAGNEHEAQMRLGMPSDTGSSLFDRWIDVDTDAGDGTDTSLAVAGAFAPGAGERTFSLVGRRYGGPGSVRAYSPALQVVVVPPADLTAPAVAVTASPPGQSASTSGEVAFSVDDAEATAECSVDDGAFAACTSPVALSGLADGPHGVRVRATDGVGNVSELASATWTVDTTPPSAPVVSAAPPATTTAREATIAFASPEAASYRCTVDGVVAPACSSPLTLTELAVGDHQVRLEALDGVGNASAATTVAWRVQERTTPTGPTTPTTPTGPTTPTRPTTSTVPTVPTGTTTRPTTVPGPAPTTTQAAPPLVPVVPAVASDALLLTCGAGAGVRLAAVTRQGAGLRITGVAPLAQAGSRVALSSGRTALGSATVAADGTFAVTLRSRRGVGSGGVVAALGTQRSAAVRPAGRLQLAAPAAGSAAARVAGRVLGRGAARRSVVVTRLTACGRSEAVATVRTTRAGRFALALPRPAAGGPVSTYRVVVRGLRPATSAWVLVGR